MKIVFKQIAAMDRCIYALDQDGQLWGYTDEDKWSRVRHPSEQEQGVVFFGEKGPVGEALDPRNPARMRANPRGEAKLNHCPRTIDSKHEFAEREDGLKSCIYCRFAF